MSYFGHLSSRYQGSQGYIPPMGPWEYVAYCTVAHLLAVRPGRRVRETRMPRP